jgi:hypothetical protein
MRGLRRQRIRRSLPFRAVLLVCGLALTLATAAAAVPAWILNSPVQVPRPDFNMQMLTGVSCASSSMCWAVGATGFQRTGQQSIVESFTGSRWTRHPGPPAPHDVGRYGKTSLASVSCPTRAACTAVGYQGNGRGVGLLTEQLERAVVAVAEHARDHGTSRRAERRVVELGAVLCHCRGNLRRVRPRHRRGRRHVQRAALARDAARASGSRDQPNLGLVRVGELLHRGRRRRPGRGMARPTVDADSERRVGYHAVSCVSATFCAVVASHGVYAFTGHSWKPMLKAPSMTLRGATCTSSVACVTVGSAAAHPVAEVLRGRTWTRQTSPHRPPPGSATSSESPAPRRRGASRWAAAPPRSTSPTPLWLSRVARDRRRPGRTHSSQ